MAESFENTEDSITNFSLSSSYLTDVIKKEELPEEDLNELGTILQKLRMCENLDSEPKKQLSDENIIDEKQILLSHLKETVENNHMNPSTDFDRALENCAQFLQSQNEKDKNSANILRKKLENQKMELNSLKKLTNFSKRIRMKIESENEAKKKVVSNNKIEEEIQQKYNDCKKDLHNVMDKLFPGDADITALLQELFMAYKQGGSASYLKIDAHDIALVNQLKNGQLIERHPTEPTLIKLASFF